MTHSEEWRDEGRKEGGLSAETAAPCSIFDYHIIETVFTAVHSESPHLVCGELDCRS